LVSAISTRSCSLKRADSWCGDGDLGVPRQVTNDGRRRLRDRSKLGAYFSKGDVSADIRDRPQLYRLDQPFEHSVEELYLLTVEAAGGRQKKIGNAPGRFQALCRQAHANCGLDFIDDRLPDGHCSS
jgi:hypothetical protein